MITTYTERGWKVFPLTKNTKTPATPNGFKDASTDPRTIKPGQNVGIATGKGLLVLDIDRKHGKDGVGSSPASRAMYCAGRRR